jgi:DNA-binding transcriptional MerR regulator
LDETRYSLQELTRAANVSVRTVRYYIAEGLLPPPVSAGARSFYGEAHLDRLRLIGLLKDSFLPLKEIRRRLMGLDDAAVRSALAEIEQQLDESDDVVFPFMEPDHRYPMIDSSVERRHRLAEQAPNDSASDYISRVLGQHRPVAPGTHALAVVPPQPAPSEADIWRRISLGDDAELLISDELFQRRKERVEALVAWAKRVLSQD